MPSTSTSSATSATSSPTPDLRYPIGKNPRRSELSAADRRAAIDAIADTPIRLRGAVRGLSEAQLDTPYRPGGWTVRQVVHHLADSHMNAFIRFRLGLTEDHPTIKPYNEAEWAKLADSALPADVSLDLLERLHQRMAHLLRSMSDADFKRTINHPENGPMTLDAVLDTYAWHGRHHTAHITSLRERSKWS